MICHFSARYYLPTIRTIAASSVGSLARLVVAATHINISTTNGLAGHRIPSYYRSSSYRRDLGRAANLSRGGEVEGAVEGGGDGCARGEAKGVGGSRAGANGL